MQSFIVLASLVSEFLVKMTPLSSQRYKKHLSPLRVKVIHFVTQMGSQSST